jgi:hypothetical protein
MVMINTRSGPAGAGSDVRIVANRRQIDNRFPVLGFTVYAGDGRYFEVWLATEASLLDPANASRRTAATFYSSREDSGLLQATGPSSVYMVPSAVLGLFANATPRPSAIYYNLVAYTNEQGTDPAYAVAPAAVSIAAPSVQMSPDFRGETLSALSTSLSRLHRVGGSAARASALSNGNGSSGGAPANGQTDAAEGEDGYSSPLESLPAPAPQPLSYPARLLSASPPYSYARPANGPNLNHQPGSISNGPPKGAAYEAPAAAAALTADDWDYSDGYEDVAGSINGAPAQASSYGDAAELGDDDPFDEDGFSFEGYAARNRGAMALSSRYPAGAPEPVSLEGGDFYDDGYGDGPPPAEYDWDHEDQLAYQSLDDPASAPAATAEQRVPLTIDEKLRIISQVAQFESSSAAYSAINADGEYAGRFNRPGENHPAFGKWHVGLSFGIIQFTQDSGVLGDLLRMMRDRDDAKFREVFGPDADELVRVTNLPGEPSRRMPDGRSARCQPIGGADLWEEPWLSRFRAAGKHPPFQAAQNELASRTFIDPMLPFAAWLGLDTDRALVTVIDRAVQLGPNGARTWIMQAVGPITTPALREQALTALGHADIRSFQRATAGLDDDGDFGPWTHAAMVAALRRLGPASPVSVMDRDQMLDAMVRVSASRRWGHRLAKLRTSADFTDTVYDLEGATP